MLYSASVKELLVGRVVVVDWLSIGGMGAVGVNGQMMGNGCLFMTSEGVVIGRSNMASVINVTSMIHRVMLVVWVIGVVSRVVMSILFLGLVFIIVEWGIWVMTDGDAMVVGVLFLL